MGARKVGMGCLGQTVVAGRQARECFREGRERERMQIGRKRFGQAWDLGHKRWHLPLLKKISFFVPGVGVMDPSIGGI
jgi:hypothetical protein